MNETFADTEIPDINKQPHTDNASQIFNLYLMLMPQNHHSQIHEINIFYLKKKKKESMTRTVCLQDDVYFATKLCFLSFTHFGIQFISLLKAQ